MEQTAAEWLARFGPLGLFALQMLGIFGLPIPDETVMVLAGVMIRRGQLNPSLTAAAAIAGAVAGISLSFFIGRYGGAALLSRLSSTRYVHRSAVDRAERWFKGVGKWLLMFGYFVPGVRHVSAIVAGVSGLPTRTFAFFASIGAALWVGCFLSIGYALADEWRAILEDAYRYAAVVVLFGGGAIAICVFWITRRRRHRAE